MLRKSLVVAFALFVMVSVDVYVYAQDAAQRTQQLVSALDKTKYKKKEKANVTVEVYVNIKNEPAIRDALAYGGNYESEDATYRLTLNVERGGAASGSGHDVLDGNRQLGFTLRDARIDGALLTGTKVYENGETQKFEAVFVNRTVVAGKNENAIESRETKFGLGFIQESSRVSSDKGSQNWTSRVFLEHR